MNKNQFRIIFNQARGVMMAVAEHVKSHSSGNSGSSVTKTTFPEANLDTHVATVRPLVFSILLSLGAVGIVPNSFSINEALAGGVVADQSAPASQRPMVTQAANGVPLVNIQTPSAAGVSRNTYSQFDVTNQGVILNNSRTNVQTQLGGYVQGNPYMAAGTARVILNEVNSSNPSLLNGYVEVAGSRAQVVIANPAGISCDGCGFINANRVTLTTGTPVMNSGDLMGYRVTGGVINFLGTGLDTSQSNYTDIIARAVNVNAGVFANDLNVITGSNQVNVAITGDISSIVPITPTGVAPTVALDVAALGGMYAGKIHLIGTEAGLGVRNAGTIGASVGEVTIDANGQLTNSGTIASTTQTALTATNITNTGGTVSAGQSLTVNTNALTGDGKLLSGGDATITLNADFTNTGEVQADGNLALSTTGNIINQSSILAGNNLTLDAANVQNNNTIAANGDLTLNATGLDNTATAQILGANTSLNVNGTFTNRGLIDGSDTFITATRLDNIGTGSIFGDHVAIAATTLNNLDETLAGNTSAAIIAARTQLDIGAQSITNQNDSMLFSAGNLNIGGALDVNHEASGSANTIDNISASIEALGNLDIKAGTLINKRSDFTISRELSTDLPSDFDLLQYNPALQFFWPYDETNPINWRNFVRNQYINSINSLLSGNLDATFRSELVALMDAQPRSVFERSINMWNLLLGRIQTDHPEYIPIMARALPNQSFPLTTYSQLCSDDECDYVTYTVTQRTDYKDVVSSNASQGLISAGAAANIQADNINNEYSTIQSGGDFTLTGTNLVNQGAELYLQSDTITSNHVIHWVDRDHGTTVYGGSTSQLIGTAPAIISAGGALTGSFTGNIDNVAIREHSALVPATGTTVPANNTVSLQTNSLFQTNPSATGNYLIETNPRFANYRTWLSSDYMLSQLSYDPATTTKRLGDGFYEQKLIREQVSELTGKRFLTGYASDEAQYQALMQNGVTYAQQYQLTPGIALSAAQIALLTSDIVWLVEKTVTLADGTTTTVLAPQLYVMPRAGDLSPSGALIAGSSVDLKLGSVLSADGNLIANQGTLKNSGTIAGRTIVAINSDSIENLGGLIQAGDNIDLHAKQDIVMQGSTTDIDIRQQNTANFVKQTTLNRMAGLYVSNPNATLSLDAGRDVTLNAAYVENAGANGTTTIKAGNNINVGVVQETQDTFGQNKNSWSKTHSTNQVGSQITTNGDITMEAKQGINIKAGDINSDNGKLTLNAGDDVNITTGEATYQSEAYRKIKTSSGFGSTKKTFHDTVDSTTNISSTLSADSISINAGKTTPGAASNPNGEINIKGSNVVATNDVGLNATGDINITGATDTHDETHLKKVKSSGFAASGASISYGTRKMSSDTKTQQTTNVGSTVGSVNGDVNIKAGLGGETGTYTQTGSDVVAPQGDINIEAQQVNILAGQDTYDSKTVTKFKQTGITLAISNPVVSAIQTTGQMVEAAKQTDDPRMQALAAATTALSVYNAAEAVKSGQGGNIAEQAGGVNLSISVGTSKSSSTSTQTTTTATSSHVIAGGDINITASGDNKDSDINVVGSTIKASDDVTLKADDQINLIAAQNTETLDSKNKNSSASVGFSVGTNGMAVTASASGGKGKANGTDVTWTESIVQGGNDSGDKVTLQSGTDTNIIGSQVAGNQVVVKTGINPTTGAVGQGNLNIQSLQDTSTFDSKQTSSGISVTVPIGAGAGYGGSISGSNTKINSDYASVNEQAGIFAGNGGYQVTTNGNTKLTGAVIASTDQAIQDQKNSLVTQTLTVSNIENKAEYEGTSSSFSAGVGQHTDSKGVVTNSPSASAGYASEKDDASSVTVSGVSGGIVNITDNVQQQTLINQDATTTVALLNRDVKVLQTTDQNGNTTNIAVDSQGNNLASTVAPIFDQEKVQRELLAAVTITQAFSAVAPKAVGDFAASQMQTFEKAQSAKDTAESVLNNPEASAENKAHAQNILDQANAVLNDPEQIAQYDNWKEGGIYRVALHTALGGLFSGDLSGALGAGISQSLIPVIGDHISQLDVPLVVKQALVEATSVAIGSAFGGTSGAATSLTATANNYLKHTDIDKFNKELADCKANNCSVAEKRAIAEKWKAISDKQQNEFIDETVETGNEPNPKSLYYILEVPFSTGIHDPDIQDIVSVIDKQNTYVKWIEISEFAALAFSNTALPVTRGASLINANRDVKSRLPNGVNVKTESVGPLNQDIIDKNPSYEPSYMPGTKAYSYITPSSGDKFVRVYVPGTNDPADTWMMRASDIVGLTPLQIQDKFALKNTPTYVVDVNLPAGQTVRASTANGIMGNGGGGVQFEVILPQNEKPLRSWFDISNARPLK